MHRPGIDVVVAIVHHGAKFYQNQTISEILHISFSLNASVRHLEFYKCDFLKTVMHSITNVCHHATFHQNW